MNVASWRYVSLTLLSTTVAVVNRQDRPVTPHRARRCNLSDRLIKNSASWIASAASAAT